MKGEAVNDYRSNASRRENLVIIGLGVLLLATTTASLLLGKYPIEPGQAIAMLVDKIIPLEQTWTDQQATLFFNVRFPRIILALLVGCCLAVAGASYQATFQNPLVSPDILGASQGAALGAAVAILLGLGASGVSIVAFAVSLTTVLIVLLVGSRARGNHMMIVVLAGFMVSTLCQAGVSYAKLVADPTNQLADITYWLMGSLTGAKMDQIAHAFPVMLIGCAILFILRWRINILTMGDDEASTMGINAYAIRIIVLVAATIITAASVSLTGMVGWVGLIVPHIMRMLVGSDCRKLIPASMISGAIFLLVVDNVARLLSTSEIPVGILTAFIGVPFFLYLITRKKKI